MGTRPKELSQHGAGLKQIDQKKIYHGACGWIYEVCHRCLCFTSFHSVFQNSKAAMQDAAFTMALVIGSENNGHGKLSIETVNEGEHKRAIGEFMQGQEQHHR